MSEPRYTQFTERMYANLPEVVRESDSLHGYALKHYISAIGDVEDQVERLVARFDYLTKQDRLGLDSLNDDHSYYGLDYSYFQVTDSKRSALVTSNDGDPVYLRSAEAYKIVPSTTIYVGAVFRTDQASTLNTYGIRLWYYDASMELVATKDVGRNNGSVGPQWNVINSTDNTPDNAYHVRISPFGRNTSGAPAKLWVDDVYVRSHYEVTTTNNLVSGGHNYLLRSEQQMIRHGDFDYAEEAQRQIDMFKEQAAIDAADRERVVHQDTAPEPAPDVLWFDTSDNNTPKVWFDKGPGPLVNKIPGFGAWTLSGGAEVVDGVLFVPQGGTAQSPLIPIEGSAFVRVYGEFLTHSISPKRVDESLGIRLISAHYFAEDGVTPAGNSTPSANVSNGNAANILIGEWTAADPAAFTTGENIAYVRVTVGGDPAWIGESGTYARNLWFTEGSVPGGEWTNYSWVLDGQPGIEWQGEPGASALVYTGPQWVELDYPEKDYVDPDSLLGVWDCGPSTELVDHALDDVPEAQSYRVWLDLKSTIADQPGYARQLIQSVSPSTTYDISLLMVRDANVPDDSTLRITISPNTGGPTIREYSMADYDRNRPRLLSFTWNSPEAVSNAIINVEYLAPVPASGLLINDISMVRFTSDVTQIGRYGDVVSKHVAEKANTEMFGGCTIRGTGWIRYETQGDPDMEPLGPDDPDLPGGTSFIESGWHQTRPGNTYTFTGEVFSSHSSGYVDLIIWYRNEGKGWGELMFHRISANVANSWVKFTRTITIPSNATEFRVNLDFYKSDPSYTLDMRNVSLKATEDRSWYVAGSRPFAFNALATRSLNFLSRGDLVHYTAKVMVTGDLSGGRGGVRVYSNGSQVVHETLIQSVETNTLLQIAGSFQVSESLADLRVALYMNDPTPKHQAAYFLSDLEVVHSTQEYMKDAKNLIRNGGFEFANALEGWDILMERETVRRNYFPDPSFEEHTPVPYNSSLTTELVTAPVRTGTKAVKITNPEGGYTRLGINLSRSSGFVGEAYVGVWVYIPASSNVKVTGFRFQDNYSARSIPIGEIPVNEWVYLSVTKPVDGVSGNNWLGLETARLDPGSYIYMDSAILSDAPGDYFDRYTPDTTLAKYKWDGETHVETRWEYQAPVNPSAYLTTAMGYNKEDVPARPEDLPLGSTSDLVDARTANTEWLPWLAQFAGRNISHFGSMEDARITLSSDNNFASGTIGAIQDAVATVLSGTQTVRVFPHTKILTQIGKATQWDVSIVTRTSESPDISVMEEAVRLRNAKPAGVTFHFHKHQSTWDAVELANPTWDIWDTRDWTGIEEAGLDD